MIYEKPSLYTRLLAAFGIAATLTACQGGLEKKVEQQVQNPPASSQQDEDLRKRSEELEKRIEELERKLAEQQKPQEQKVEYGTLVLVYTYDWDREQSSQEKIDFARGFVNRLTIDRRPIYEYGWESKFEEIVKNVPQNNIMSYVLK